MADRQTVYVIACGVLGPEIKHLVREMDLELKLNFLPGKLHNKPDLLRTTLQDAIDKAAEDPLCSRIVVGYGLCGRGTVKIIAPRVPLVFPMIHDCISLFLGSDQAYNEQFFKYPGTYYFTEGWHDEKGQTIQEDGKTVWVGDRAMGCTDLEKKYGKKNGTRLVDFFSSWKSNYQRVAYIDTGVPRRERAIQAAEDMADENKWEFHRLSGNLSLLRKLLTSDCSDDDIVFVPAGHETIYSGVGNCLAFSPVGEDSVTHNGSRQFMSQGSKRRSGIATTARFGLGVDAGGTYTDGVIYDFFERRIVAKNKSLTTRWDFTIGIKNCLAGLKPELLRKAQFVSVSTTLATNAIVEGAGQRVGLLLMGGTRLEGDPAIQHTPKVFIKGRINIRGVESEAVDQEEVRQVAQQMVGQQGVTAFAVSGYGGSINPVHEQLVRDILVEETSMVVCCGHDFSSQLNFVTRAQTAVVNGQVIPRMIGFFGDLDQVLEGYDIRVPIMVVKGDGTLISRKEAMQKPVETVFSGPAASVAGARFLTGLDNAMVVDIGGTTTDSADIVDGEVAVAPEGAVVGDIQTHVRALKMKTVGLGGDSHIKFSDAEFSLGPRRVAPLVWADTVTEAGIESALASIAVHSIRWHEQIVLIALEGGLKFHPTPVEKQIYDILLDSPQTPEQLADSLGVFSARLLQLDRLEQSGLVQRCGLTPTDLLHVKKLFTRWPETPARRMMDILSLGLKKHVDQLTDELLQLVDYKLGLELLSNSVLSGFTRQELDGSPLYSYLSEALLGRKEGRYGIRAVFDHAMIGIGAPSKYFLPGAADMLSAKVIIPEDGDVANALGAVTSSVQVRKRLVVRPDSGGGYVVEGVIDTPRFKALEAAEEWVVSYLIKHLRKDAREAGTNEETVTFDIDDRFASLRDGSSMLLERNISAYVKGCPSLPL
ncbi:MAG: DUF1638 domain-containing protein [Desulforhopalus sp.]